MISIIIPSYNSTKTIGYTLNGILSQKKFDTEVSEIIVVDSSENNAIFELISEIKNDKIKIIRVKNKTIPAIARNIGADKAMGHLLVFIDSDAYPDKDWMDNILLSYSGGCRVGGGSVMLPDFQVTNIIAIAQLYLQFNEYLPFGNIKHKAFVPSCNLFCEKSIFNRVGGFPALRAAEDVVFGIKVNELDKLQFIPKIKVFHIFRENLSDFLKNQILLGRYVAIYRKNNFDSTFYRGVMPIILSPFFLCIKISKIIFRVARSGATHFFKLILVGPIFILGLCYWYHGFLLGCGYKGDGKD
jgi:hypothetical protein